MSLFALPLVLLWFGAIVLAVFMPWIAFLAFLRLRQIDRSLRRIADALDSTPRVASASASLSLRAEPSPGRTTQLAGVGSTLGR